MTRHRLDIPSLLLGLFFTTIAVVTLSGGWSLSVGPWLWPSVLIGAGVVVLLAVVAAGRDRDDVEVFAEVDAASDTDPVVMAEAHAEAEAADPFA